MLPVQTLARRIRYRLHDTDEITYENEEILDCINNGIRFIRRLIANMRPTLLMSEITGILEAGEKSATLAKTPIKIINVTVGKGLGSEKALKQTEMSFIVPYDSNYKGEPKEFFLTGSKTINFYPVPSTQFRYTIRTVDDIEEVEWGDNSPLSNEFDDFLVEYVTVRLSVGNEYDMTQETQFLANIVAQIQQILIPPPAGVLTKNYWGGNSRSTAGGYW